MLMRIVTTTEAMMHTFIGDNPFPGVEGRCTTGVSLRAGHGHHIADRQGLGINRSRSPPSANERTNPRWSEVDDGWMEAKRGGNALCSGVHYRCTQRGRWGLTCDKPSTMTSIFAHRQSTAVGQSSVRGHARNGHASVPGAGQC